MSSAGKASKGRRSTGPSVHKLQRELTSVYSDLRESRNQHSLTRGTLSELERKYAWLEQSKAVVEMTVREQAERIAHLNGWSDGWTSRQRELDAQRIKEIKARIVGCDGE